MHITSFLQLAGVVNMAYVNMPMVPDGACLRVGTEVTGESVPPMAHLLVIPPGWCQCHAPSDPWPYRRAHTCSIHWGLSSCFSLCVSVGHPEVQVHTQSLRSCATTGQENMDDHVVPVFCSSHLRLYRLTINLGKCWHFIPRQFTS